MDIYTIIILFLIGALAGAASSFLGIGGGLVIVPLLVLVLGYSQKTAQGTSLLLMLPPIGILAAINYYKAGYANVTHAIIIIIGFVVSSYFASKAAVTIHDYYLKKIFAAAIVLYALKLFLEKQ